MICLCCNTMSPYTSGKTIPRWFKCNCCSMYGRNDIKGGRTYWSLNPYLKLYVPPGCLALFGSESKYSSMGNISPNFI